MKKVLVICALIMMMFNVCSCTPDPVLETFETEGTVGEDSTGEDDPDN